MTHTQHTPWIPGVGHIPLQEQAAYENTLQDEFGGQGISTDIDASYTCTKTIAEAAHVADKALARAIDKVKYEEE